MPDEPIEVEESESFDTTLHSFPSRPPTRHELNAEIERRRRSLRETTTSSITLPGDYITLASSPWSVYSGAVSVPSPPEERVKEIMEEEIGVFTPIGVITHPEARYARLSEIVEVSRCAFIAPYSPSLFNYPASSASVPRDSVVRVTPRFKCHIYERFYWKCSLCDGAFTDGSFLSAPLMTERGNVSRQTCLRCAERLWRERGPFLTCQACRISTLRDTRREFAVNRIFSPVACLCLTCALVKEICSVCGEVKRRGEIPCSRCQEIAEREILNRLPRMRYIPSRCLWERDFKIQLSEDSLYESETFKKIARKVGEVSNTGIERIASLLHDAGYPITFRSYSKKEGERNTSVDVTKDITYLSGKGFPSIAKEISAFYYKHYKESDSGKPKVSESLMEEIGRIASEYTAKESQERYYCLTRDFDRPREYYCHDHSCWWSERPLSFCYLKQYGGMFIVGRDSDTPLKTVRDEVHCLSRGAILPLKKEGVRYVVSNAWKYDAPLEIDAYFLFNVYGEDGYISMATVLSKMLFREQVLKVEIDPLPRDLWINGRITTLGTLTHSFGYLLLPQGVTPPHSLIPGSLLPRLSIGDEGMSLSCVCRRRRD